MAIAVNSFFCVEIPTVSNYLKMQQLLKIKLPTIHILVPFKSLLKKLSINAECINTTNRGVLD